MRREEGERRREWRRGWEVVRLMRYSEIADGGFGGVEGVAA